MLRARREFALDRGAGALQGARHGGDRRVEHLGGLLGAEVEHLPEDQHGALVRRQELEGRDVGELDRLSLLVPEQLVGVRLDPNRLGQRLGERFAWVVATARRAWHFTPLAALEDAQRGIGGDRVEPGAKRAASLEPGASLPGAQQRLLERIVRVVNRAQHPVAVRVKLAAVRLGQLGEGGFIGIPNRLGHLLWSIAAAPREFPLTRSESLQ